MSHEGVSTFQDAVERLLDNPGELGRDGLNYRRAKGAVIDAYRDLPSYHEWKYYKRKHIFQSDANYNIGTVAYDHTGGSSERIFTLTGGTWPANAALGVVQIATNHWPISSRISDTVVQASEENNPGADIASGTSYEWYREAYALPAAGRKVGRLTDNADYSFLTYVDADHALLLSRNRTGGTINRPELFTIRPDDRALNRLDIILIPPGNAAKTYEYIEDIEGNLLTVAKLEGTASVTGGQTTVTVSASVLTSALHKGAILRLSSDANAPTSLRGGLNADNPYVVQRKIASITNGTTLEVDEAIADTYSNVAYTISSPIDIEVGAMQNVFWELCRYHFLKDSQQDRLRIEQVYHQFIRCLEIAMNADRRSTEVASGHQQHGYFPNWLPVGNVDASF